MRPQPSLFDDDLPQGFIYRPDVVNLYEEATLVRRFEALPLRPFEFHGHHGKRRVTSFGWRSDYSGRALNRAETLPDFLLPLRDIAASVAGLDADALQQALVTEYAAGAGIGWHRDRPDFHEVVAFSFLSPCTLRLRRREAERWQRRRLSA